jgi:uncharacterized membrane protein
MNTSAEWIWLVLLTLAAPVLLIILSIPMIRRKVKPNGWYGVRVPATLKNEALWYDANEYGGKALCAASVITLIAALVMLVAGVSPEVFFTVITIVMIGALLIAVMQIFRYIGRYPK